MNLMPDGAMFATKNSSKKSVGKNSENLATEPIARHLVAAHNQKSHPTLLVESESNHKRINPPEDWVEQEFDNFHTDSSNLQTARAKALCFVVTYEHSRIMIIMLADYTQIFSLVL